MEEISLLSLNEYANLVLKNRSNPHVLADLQLEMAVKAAYVSEGYKPIKVKKAVYWQKKYDVDEGKKPLSENYMETQWEASELGLKEIRMKIELDGLDRLIQACKSIQFDASREARNI